MKLSTTPKSQIKHALRRLFMGSREKNGALKQAKYRCQKCGIKQTTAKGFEIKVNVHHIDGINWEELIDVVQHTLLPDPSRLIVLCEQCHEMEHKDGDGI